MGAPEPGGAGSGLCLACGAGAAALGGFGGALPLLSFALCGFAAWVNVRELLLPPLLRARQRQVAMLPMLWRSWMLQKRRTGGYLVHLAVVMIVVGITASQAYRISSEASLGPGESLQLGPYSLTFVYAKLERGTQRESLLAQIRVEREGKPLGYMQPRLNYYPSMREPVGTPHVVTLGSSDLYLSLLSVQRDMKRVGIKAFSIPMVPYIWRSLPLLVLGSMISLWPRRRALPPQEG
ncbi:MAG: hypothetical protein EOO40_05590 [Deltaproteobacteria bacterium]|nr:MAG: hypothetical protein EOO40_05590 [Deltaproteobacteria bacterium]